MSVKQMKQKNETAESSRVYLSQTPHQSFSLSLDPEKHNERVKGDRTL
jgi:hypothetical protein